MKMSQGYPQQCLRSRRVDRMSGIFDRMIIDSISSVWLLEFSFLFKGRPSVREGSRKNREACRQRMARKIAKHPRLGDIQEKQNDCILPWRTPRNKIDSILPWGTPKKLVRAVCRGGCQQQQAGRTPLGSAARPLGSRSAGVPPSQESVHRTSRPRRARGDLRRVLPCRDEHLWDPVSYTHLTLPTKRIV